MSLNEIMSRLQYKKAKKFFEDIRDTKYAHVKGEALSIQAYGEVGHRVYTDLDIIVSRPYLQDIKNILSNNGYISSQRSRSDEITMLSSSHQISPWFKTIEPWKPLVIDLNFDILWGEYEGKRIDMDEFLNDTIEMNVYGVNIRTLPAVKSLIHILLHCYKDMNSIFLIATRKKINMQNFNDIYHMINNNIDVISVNSLYEMSSKYDIIPYVFYVLFYTREIFGDNILDDYIDAFKTKEGETLLNQYGLCKNERKEWRCDFKNRLSTTDLYEIIKHDLTTEDHEKIKINKHVFLGIDND